jgi:hypothetical protein
MEILKKRERVETISYEHVYKFRTDPEGGYYFPCDEHGNIIHDEYYDFWKGNLEKCQRGELDVIDKGIVANRSMHWEPAVGRCSSCGASVTLYDPVTNECTAINKHSGKPCGALYNGCGQDLAPRSQWDPRGEY